MATQVLFRRGTTSQNDNFMGGVGELTVNLSNVAVRVHNGTTLGGVEMARADLTNVVGNALGKPGGSNTNIQYNDNNDLAGSNAFTFNNTTNVVTASNFTAANLTVGTVVGNLIPSANATMNLGNATNRWKDLYISGNTIFMDDAQIRAYQQTVLIRGLSITANGAIDIANAPAPGSMFVAANLTAGNANIVTTLTAANANIANISGNTANYGNIIAGNITVTGNVQVAAIVNGNSNVTVLANSAVTVGANGISNIMVVNSNGVSASTSFKDDVIINGNLSVTGNATYINVASQTIQNPIVGIGVGANASPITAPDGFDRGIAMHEFGTAVSRVTSVAAPAGTTFIPLTNVTGITLGMQIGNPNSAVSIPIGTTVTRINAANIQISSPTGANIAPGTILNIGTDAIRFMGWDTGNSEMTMASNVTQVGSVITVNQLANVRANVLLGNIVGNTANFANDVAIGGNLTLTGNLEIATIRNGNSNVRIAANGFVTTSVGGNANILTVTDTGANVTGTLSATTNLSVGGNANITGNENLTGNLSVGGIADITGVSRIRANIQMFANANIVGQTPNLQIQSPSTLNLVGGDFVQLSYVQDYANANSATAFNTNQLYVDSQGITLFNNAGNVDQTAQFDLQGRFTAPRFVGVFQGNLASGNTSVNLFANGNVVVNSNGVSNIAVVSGAIVQTNYTSTALVALGATVIPLASVLGLAVGQVLNAPTFLPANTTITNITGLNVTVSAAAILAAPLGTTFFTNTPRSNVTIADALTVGGVSTLGPVGNVKITGGTDKQYLQTDGTGNLTWATVDSFQIANGNSNVVVAANADVTIASAGIADILVVSVNPNQVDYTSTAIVALGATVIPLDTVVGLAIGQVLNAPTFLPANTTITNITGLDVTVSAAAILAAPLGTVFFTTAPTGLVTITDDAVISDNANIGGDLTVIGNVNIASIRNGNSNIAIAANGNVSTSVAGNANVFVVTGTGANINGTANVTGNAAFGGNVVIDGNLTVAGNINIDFLVNGNSNVVVEANSNVVISASGVANVLTASASVNQVNYTSTAIVALGATVIPLNSVTGLVAGQVLNAPTFLTPGTTVVSIAGLDVTVSAATILEAPLGTTFFTTAPASLVRIGDALRVIGKTNLNSVGNITITGGTDKQFLQTDGAGNLTWATSSQISNGNSNVIVNPNANVTISSAGNANIVTVTGTGVLVSGQLDTTSKVIAAGINSTGLPFVTNDNQDRGLSMTRFGSSTSYTSTGVTTLGATIISLNNVTGLVAGQVLNAPTFLTPGTKVASISGLDVTIDTPTILLAPTGTTFFTTVDATSFMGYDNSNNEMLIASSVTVSGNVVTVVDLGNTRVGGLNVQGETNLNAVGNITITGGTDKQFLQTDGAGNLTWATVDSFQIANGNSNVVVAANANITIGSNGVANVVTVSAATNPATYTNTAVVVLGATIISLNTVAGLSVGKVLSAPTFLVPGTTITNITGLNVTVSVAAILEAPIGTAFTTTTPTSLLALAGNLTVGASTSITGNLTVASVSNLGPVGNVIITGGNSGEILVTNGSGSLSWEAPAETQPFIRFVVPANGIDQTFTNANIAAYANANVINVVKDGVYLEAGIDYEFANATTIQVTSYLDQDSVIDVLASPAGGASLGALTATYNAVASIAVGDVFMGSNTATTITFGQITTERPNVTNSAGASSAQAPAGTYKFLGGSAAACLWTRTA